MTRIRNMLALMSIVVLSVAALAEDRSGRTGEDIVSSFPWITEGLGNHK
ncbi:MAG: hypothetical protein GKR90_27155 [Pseudomonadales bacterium]|nr:hypothetical protein [Pseudomonadales bacterium]